MKSVKPYRGADMYSDHNPVIMEFRFKRLLKLERQKSQKVDIAKLQNSKKFRIGKEIEGLTNLRQREDIKGTWNVINTKITKIQEHYIGFTKNNEKKE